MKINSDVKPVKFTGEGEHEHSSISVSRSNLCELYRDGISFAVENGDNHFSVLLKVSEVERMRRFLNLYTNNCMSPPPGPPTRTFKDALFRGSVETKESKQRTRDYDNFMKGWCAAEGRKPS